MLPAHISTRVQQVHKASSRIMPFAEKYFGWVANANGDTADFAFGNPHEMPLQSFVDALAKQVPPQNKDWYAYKFNEFV